ncbi:MAG: helix-turn-helix transcriptional regulator [Mobilitalea sp.]
MDLIKIGKFIAELRRESKITQEDLGEKLGVTNKTISRWENGNYLPGVEMLQILSNIFSVSINELLCGERLDDNSYRQKADDMIINVLKSSTFSLKERCDSWKKKWIKDHKSLIILCVFLFLITFGIGFYINMPIWSGLSIIISFILYLKIRNDMMAYIENHAYDSSGQ